MQNATSFLFSLAILVMSVVIHEVSHGIAAYLQGDKTAKYAGRLTLNPIPHIDPVGSLLIPFLLVISNSPFLIGWAKPVPYNPYNLRNQKYGPAIVGAAGPLSNIFIAAFFSIVIRLADIGTLAFLPESFVNILFYVVVLNLSLAVFNLVPIPPLDGSKVLSALLPYRYGHILETMETWGFVLLIIFIMAFGPVVGAITNFLIRLFLGSSL